MKYGVPKDHQADVSKSHSAWSAWIEILLRVTKAAATPSRTPHGVRGLKSTKGPAGLHSQRRTPHGVRGLKFSSIWYKVGYIAVALRMECVD